MLLTIKQLVDENDIGYCDFKDTLDGNGIDTFACYGICEIDDEGNKQKLADALVRDTGLDLSEVVNYRIMSY